MDIQFYNDAHINTLQTYIEANFTLDGTSKHLINNILRFVAAQGEDGETTLVMLMSLLDGIGLMEEEVVSILNEES